MTRPKVSHEPNLIAQVGVTEGKHKRPFSSGSLMLGKYFGFRAILHLIGWGSP